ncbi:MAG: sigma 54-interacting transcriptional regulator [Ignavibacteriaceae bacterium]|nr:sigma 54-interacting transcriptional regulator [Ignavibacteriaceae bacterium]
MVAWNKRGEEILGYSTEELHAVKNPEFAQESDREKLRAAFIETLVKGSGSLEFTIETKSGKKIPVLTRARACEIEGEVYLIGLSIDISDLVSAREKINEQMKEISRLNDLLKAENIYLKDQFESTSIRNEIIGESNSIKYIHFKIKQVAPTNATVLIEGETGTGKELVARAIHKESKRSNKPFIKVNCASIPENLIESELFGHEKGAFTGAFEKRIGRFELANGGTIFLDEICELPLNVQPKLLHILQQGEFERIGSSKTIKTDVRIIAATNKILTDEIKRGKFRNDLFYRLNVFPISVTPLRNRKEDIPLLMEYYLKYYSEKLNKPIKTIPKKIIKRMMEYSWPGNVRELENVIERAIITSETISLNIESFPTDERSIDDNLPLEELERSHIIKTLEKTYWKISGPGGAAEILKMNPETLRSKMRKLGIKRNNGK